MDVRRAERDAVEAADRVLLRDGPVGGSRERRVRGDEFEAVPVVVAEGDDRLVEPLGRGVHAPRIETVVPVRGGPFGDRERRRPGLGLAESPRLGALERENVSSVPGVPAASP